MSARKKTISLPKTLLDKAETRARELHYSTFSDYLQELIRRDTMSNNAGSGPELHRCPRLGHNTCTGAAAFR